MALAARFRVPSRLLQKTSFEGDELEPAGSMFFALLLEWVQSITSTATQFFLGALTSWLQMLCAVSVSTAPQ